MTDTTVINNVETISTGALNARLKFINVQANNLEALGFVPAGTIKAGKYWALKDLPAIQAALIKLIQEAA